MYLPKGLVLLAETFVISSQLIVFGGQSVVAVSL
jgi:hypothetical protein